VYRSVHVFVENCGKVTLKLATYNTVYARQGYQEPRIEFFVYVPERDKVRMNRSTLIPY
jgi:hypothetical protein